MARASRIRFLTACLALPRPLFPFTVSKSEAGRTKGAVLQDTLALIFPGKNPGRKDASLEALVREPTSSERARA